MSAIWGGSGDGIGATEPLEHARSREQEEVLG
jgi:hypothetical protein